MSALWIRSSIVYLVLCLIAWVSTLFVEGGLQMILIGSTILIGALIMSLCGAIHKRRPRLAEQTLALFHFCFYQVGTPALLVAFYLTLEEKIPDLRLALFSVGGSFMFLGTVLFVIGIRQDESLIRKEADER